MLRNDKVYLLINVSSNTLWKKSNTKQIHSSEFKYKYCQANVTNKMDRNRKTWFNRTHEVNS